MAHADGRHHAGNGHAVCRTVEEITYNVLHGVVSTRGATVPVVVGATVPASGYVVAVDGHEWSRRWVETTGADVREYVERKRRTAVGGFVSRPRAIGAWLDADGTLYLDVVEILQNRDAAVAAGRARGESAVWDIARGEEIRTD